MAWLVFAALFAIWIVGVIGDIGGVFVHLVLVAALVLLVYQLAAERRATL